MSIMEVLFAFIAVAVLFIAHRSYRNAQRAKQEKELFALAIKKEGRVTIAEIVSNTTLNAAQAESILNAMHQKGHVGRLVTEAGLTIYEFNNVPHEEILQPVPSPKKGFSVKEQPVFEKDEEDEEESASNFVENIQTASNAYRNWLPEVLQKLESYHRYPAAVALPKFKEYVKEKIAYYEDAEAKSQARINEDDASDNQVYFMINVVLNFSSGPMVKVLKRVLEQIQLWEANPEEIEAAAVIDAIRQILNEEIHAEQ